MSAVSPLPTPARLPLTRSSARERLLTAVAPFLGLAVVVVIFYAVPPHPSITLLDLQTVAVQTVIVGIAAMGMTFIIISGGIDLSVGSSIALASVTAALTFAGAWRFKFLDDLHLSWLNPAGPLNFAGQHWPIVTALVVALVTGALCGLYNSLLITLLRLPPFIATLGTMGFYRGVAKWISASTPVNIPIDAPAHPAVEIVKTWVYPMPDPKWLTFAPAVFLTLILVVFLAAVLRYTILGRYTFALGSNEATARLCGIRVPRIKVYIYALAGVLTGLAGLMQFARLTQGDPTVSIGLELDVIAAVVIGGGSLSGGQGSMVGTLAGAFMMAYLRNRCTALGWQNYVQEMIVGHIIIIAVAVDQLRVRRTER